MSVASVGTCMGPIPRARMYMWQIKAFASFSSQWQPHIARQLSIILTDFVEDTDGMFVYRIFISPYFIHFICFLFSHHSSADKEQQGRFPGPEHTNRFVLLIESICFWIATNERAIRSDNTSEETAARWWVTATSAIKDQQSLKGGISSFPCRPAVSLIRMEPLHRLTASLDTQRDSSQMGEGCGEGSGLFVDLG